MKKIAPILLALLSIGFLIGMILKNEWHLKQSKTIYVSLQPVDPRSLIQGDYMTLRYNLALADISITDIRNTAKITAYVQLDTDQKVIRTSLSPSAQSTQKLILRNPKNYLESLYPATQSFLFAEGLASCYEQAKFAEFKVDEQGHAILADLHGEDLKPLHCKNRQKWWQGHQED